MMAKLHPNAMYFRWKITRTTGLDDMPHKWHAKPGTDAETEGRFSDSVTGFGSMTVYPGQSYEQVFQLYEEKIRHGCEDIGYDSHEVKQITLDEFETDSDIKYFQIRNLDAQFFSPAYEGAKARK